VKTRFDVDDVSSWLPENFAANLAGYRIAFEMINAIGDGPGDPGDAVSEALEQLPRASRAARDAFCRAVGDAIAVRVPGTRE